MLRPLSLLVATAVIGLSAASEPALAGALNNRDGCGMYSPEAPIVRGAPREYRYDPRSWCYKPRGYYGYYGPPYGGPRFFYRHHRRHW